MITKARNVLRRLHGLSGYAITASLIPAVLMLCLVTPYTIYQRTDDSYRLFNDRGESTARLLAQVSDFGLSTGEFTYLNPLVVNLLNDRDIYRVCIRDAKGKLVLDRTDGTFQHADESKSFSAHIIRSVAPAPAFDLDLGFEANAEKSPAQRQIGEVEIFMSTNGVLAAQREIAINGMLLALIALAISWYLGHRFGRSLVRPLSQLIAAVAKMRAGNFTGKLGNSSRTEIGVLARDIEALASELGQAKHSVERHLNQLTDARDIADRDNASKLEAFTVVSRELRNPITAAYGVVQLIQDSEIDSVQRRYVDLAIESLEHAQRLLDDVYDYSAIESQRFRIDAVPTRLKQTVSKVVSIYTPMAHQKGLEMRLAFGGDFIENDVIVYADETRVRQIVRTLLDNALRFTSRGGIYVHLSGIQLNPQQMAYTLEVKDTGAGITEDRLASVFEKGHFDISNSCGGGGLGLGLYIVKNLVEKMDGRVSVRSRPGHGSTFSVETTVTLAFGELDCPPSFPTLPFDRNDRGSVLVVDSDSRNVAVLVELLQLVGTRTDSVSNTDEALAMVRSMAYDMILIDCHMANDDGYNLARLIRTREETENIARTALMAITSVDNNEIRTRCGLAGFDDILTKPYRKIDIYRRVTAIKHVEAQIQELAHGS